MCYLRQEDYSCLLLCLKRGDILNIGNIEVYGIIYKIQNKINQKVYIGQTIKKNGFKNIIVQLRHQEC